MILPSREYGEARGEGYRDDVAVRREKVVSNS
jgi:hypothetical protein